MNETVSDQAQPGKTQTLLFHTSPYGNLDAIVEHDGRVVYFYLNGSATESQSGDQRFGTRACWVRNLVSGPYVMNNEQMQQGLPPLLPRTHCKYSDGRPLLDPDRLEVIWLEEGNGAALIERAETADDAPEVLAVIPPWSGLDGFQGYARDCATGSPLCWPLPDNPRLLQRLARSAEFWSEFAEPLQTTDSSREPTPNLFAGLQQNILAAYEKHFPTHESANDGRKYEGRYFAIDGGRFPPRGMIVFERDDSLTAMTVGMSLCPQPAVELFSDQPSGLRRIELGIHLDRASGLGLSAASSSSDSSTSAAMEAVLGQLSSLAAMPWKLWIWLGPGHTTSFDSFSALKSNRTEAAGNMESAPEFGLLIRGGQMPGSGIPEAVKSRIDQLLSAAPPVELPSFRDDPVNLLWIVPLSSGERDSLAGSD